ncbi:MAG: acyltransferase, partial [Eubacterium sp.]|nr:acyltransferase [Eubacterium sp.]
GYYNIEQGKNMNNNGLTKKDSLAMKGIAIIIMVFHHLFCEVSRFENYDVSFAPFSQDFVVSVSLMMKICVSIFAFITGYGLLKSIAKTPLDRSSVFKWNITRLLKTMSGFYFVYVITFVTTQLLSGLPMKAYFSGSKIKGILYVLADFSGLSALFGTPKLIGTWWYMSAAVIFILLVPIIYSVSKKIGYLPVVAVVIILPRLLNVGYPGGINPYSFILPMVFGMIFSDYNLFEKLNTMKPKNKTAAYITDFIFFGLSVVFFYFVSINFKTSEAWEILFGVSPVFFICFCRYCIIRIPVLKTILEYLGKHSFTLFLTHSFIRYTYLNEFTYSFGNFMVIFIVLFILSLLLAVVIDFIKQLVQYDKLINKLIISINKKVGSE